MQLRDALEMGQAEQVSSDDTQRSLLASPVIGCVQSNDHTLINVSVAASP
ncbi:MAG: hypothetical protein GPOALKHO_001192 [Sodalis sp.]|nr:MAG: hypothetical protein GPOALKHO_001192 [Sodalis sp.]